MKYSPHSVERIHIGMTPPHPPKKMFNPTVKKTGSGSGIDWIKFLSAFSFDVNIQTGSGFDL